VTLPVFGFPLEKLIFSVSLNGCGQQEATQCLQPTQSRVAGGEYDTAKVETQIPYSPHLYKGIITDIMKRISKLIKTLFIIHKL
jgi:hypothetical protein